MAPIPTYDTTRLVKVIALILSIAFALPVLARLYRAMVEHDWTGAFLLCCILAALGVMARWLVQAAL